MKFPQRLFLAASMAAVLLVTAGLALRAPASEVQQGKAVKARPKVSLLTGGADGDLKVLRDTLQKIPGLTFKADELGYADFGRDGGTFTNFLTLDIADLTKTDIGAIAKSVAAANTSKKEQCPSALYVIIRYLPGSVKDDKLRAALAKVKGVRADKSWAGDSNLWVRVDDSGQARLGEITRALHFAGIKIQDPITDISK